MLVRIIVSLALIVFLVGFVWFAAQVIWLGTKEFFKIHMKGGATATAPTTSSASSATPTTTVAP